MTIVLLMIIPVVLGYLIGSVTFSYVVGKWFLGIDVREHGSGNAGATNTLRTLGKWPGVFVLILDLLKGVLAVMIGKWLAPEHDWVAVASGVAAVVGHNWPVFFKFKGGKGVATTIGVALTLSFWATFAAIVIIVIIIAITRYVSLGSLVFALLLPTFIWLFYDPLRLEVWLASLAFALFTFVRHKQNIVKLVRGQENKLGAKRDDANHPQAKESASN